jgi:hypothetical protein
MTDTLRLIAQYAKAYDFRSRGPFEGQRQYLEALIVHVENRDMAAAHELRVGRPQKDWTPDDVASFRDRMLRTHRPAARAVRR